MIYRNTTDIPDRLIAIAIAHSIQAGVDVKEVIVKNKKAGKTFGRWGVYFPEERRIEIIVPRIMRYGFTYTLAYTQLKQRIETRTEFAVSVLAHELRHAWQHQLGPRDTWNSEAAREVDAELYELSKWREWRELYGEVARAAKGVK